MREVPFTFNFCSIAGSNLEEDESWVEDNESWVEDDERLSYGDAPSHIAPRIGKAVIVKVIKNRILDDC